MADSKKPIKMQLPTKKAQGIITTSKGHVVKNTSLLNVSGYGKGDTVMLPLTRSAQAIGGGASVTMTQPMFFSPLHTPQNWQIASKRREVYQWCVVDSEENPAFLSLNGDFRQQRISTLFDEADSTSSYMTDDGEIRSCENLNIAGFSGSTADKISKRKYTGEVVSFETMGLPGRIIFTDSHKCIVVKSGNIKENTWNKKNRVDENGFFVGKIEMETVLAKDIEKGDYIAIPFSDEIKYNDDIDEEDAYFMGLIAGDGWICDGDNKSKYKCIGVCWSENEDHINRHVKNIFEKRNIYSNVCENTDTVKSLRTSSKEFYDLISKYISVDKNHEKYFTENAMLLDPAMQLKIIAGFIDSDGDYNKINKNINITCYNFNLAWQIMHMFFRNRIPARINKTKISKSSKTFKTNNTHRYIVSVPSSFCSILSDIGCHKAKNKEFKQKRQNKRFFYKNNLMCPVAKIDKYDYEGYVYNVECPPVYKTMFNGILSHQCRFYYENEPKVAAGIDFYSQFPVNGFKLECKKKKITAFYERLCDRLELLRWLRLISHERFLLGDVFVFLEIDSPDTRGETELEPGEAPSHADGTFKRIMVLNPDWIEVYNTPLAGEPEIVMLPDEELKKIVMTRQPESIYKRLPNNIKQLVASGQPIRLSNNVTSHIKHGGSPYGTYGDSLLRRLFTILAYKTKLMTANWITAERLILPVRVVKVGNAERPAGEDDIADVVQQLSAVANDPNLTIVTHHAFEYEWFGACYDEETLFLTDKYGWMSSSEYKNIIYEEDDPIRIMVFDPNTGQSFYEIPSEFYEYDYDGFMVKAKGNKIDFMVTPNHKMLGYKRDKKTSYSMEAKDFVKIGESDRYVRSVADYVSEEFIETVNIDGNEIFIDDFLKFAGYYLAEGYTQFDEERRRYIVSISQSPYVNKEYCDDISTFANNINSNVKIYSYDQKVTTWNYLNKNIAKYVKEQFGDNSYTKKIPQWVKNLPPEKLSILIEAYINGDGARQSYSTGDYVQMGTVSHCLAKDLSEILFKSGFAPIISEYKKEGKQFIINCSMGEKSKGRFSRIKDDQLSTERYKGKVWCFTTSTGFFVTQRNGRISIQGNSGKIHNITNELEMIGKEMLDGMMLNQALLNGEASAYQSAQVGVEMLIRRLESWRKELAQWVEKNIFLPVAKMQGFIDEDESQAFGETVYLYPHLKWDDLKLRDPTNRMQMAMNLHQNGTISTQTLLEMFELDYDQEIERIREEQVQVIGNGQVMPGGAPGGPPGGMPGGMPGGPPGGMPGGDPMGGMPPGMPMGDPMGGAPMGGPPGAMPAAAQSTQRVTKKGKGGDKKEELPPPPVQNIQLTKPEAKVYRILSSMKVPFQLYAQYKYQVPGEQQPYLLDFAIPELGLNIEADGEQWHSTAEDKTSDQKRDYKLAEMGWTVIRVSETALNENAGGVEKLLGDNIRLSVEQRRKMNSKSANSKLASYKFADSETGLRKCYLVKSIPQYENE